MLLSKFVHIFEREGEEHFALYHAGKIKTLFVANHFLPLVKSWQGETLEQYLENVELVQGLKEQGFIVDDNEDEQFLKSVISTFNPELMVLYLILTDECNLDCKYCFIEGGFPDNYQRGRMSWQTAKKAIDLFLEQLSHKETGDIWFYGGEPLLESDLFFQCLDYLKAIAPQCCATIVTNGTLVTSEIACKIAQYPQLHVSVSIDGPEDVHNRERIYKNGAGSYADAIKGVNNLKKAKVDFGISCTIAKHNVDNVSNVVNWLNQEFGTNSIGVNFLVDTPKEFVAEDYIRRANSGLIDFFAQYRDGEIIESRILRKVEAFVKQQPRWHDCAACGFQMVIAPNGEIGICHEGLGERRTFVGSINEDFDFHRCQAVQEWASRSPASMPECQKCAALGICGGGCPYGAMLKYGSIWEIDRRFCIHSQETLAWLIWDLYDKVKTRLEAH